MGASHSTIDTLSFKILQDHFKKFSDSSVNVSPFGIGQIFDIMYHKEDKNFSNVFSKILPSSHDSIANMQRSYCLNFRSRDNHFSSLNKVIYDCRPSEENDFLNCMSDIRNHVDISTTRNGIGDLTISNTLSISSSWRDEFTDKDQKRFTTLNGSNKNVRFMGRSLEYYDRISVTPAFTAVKTSTSEDFSFEAIMPSSNFMSTTIDQINNIHYHDEFRKFSEILIPQFEVQTTLDLIPHLHSQGIPISKYKIQVNHHLGVQKCSQNSKFELTTKGFKGSSYTECVMSRGFGSSSSSSTICFDKPFYWVVRKGPAIIFTGIFNA